MEYSSPLAAMRPQPAWGSRKDVPISRSMFSSFQTCGPSSFDFKTMSMNQQQYQQRPTSHRNDYFAVRPARGSSPTSSLTADLDANFHIDKSPQAPTPRRSLFTTDFLRPREDGHLMTPPIESEGVTTPPIPSSSPGYDAMDISPLPHKVPHFSAKITLPSPSPEGTPMLSEEILAENLHHEQRCMVADAAPAPPTFLQLPERRRPVTRPSLSRTKAQSANVVPQRPTSAETSLPAFRFGNGATNGLSCSSTPSLLESFTESPVDEPRPSTGQQMPSTSVRRPSLGGVNRANGSPIGAHVRKPSGGRPAFVRPQRKVMRRSLSMFQHPDDVMQEEQDTFEPQPNLAAVMDVDQEHKPKLPHFMPADKHDGLPRISQDTMADILNGQYNSEYDRISVVDCRFEYEYNGGHIENAVNFNDKSLLANQLFNNEPSTGSTLLIFHCEYSVHRAPMTAAFIRSRDREVNCDNYPRLTYPELYVLEGGYSQFFAQHRSKCFPQSYVEMNDQRHEQACERGMAKVKQRQKLFRHQTFAFGEGHDEVDDSPTAMGRNMGPRTQSSFNVGCDITEGIGQSFARRMASY